MNNALAFPVPVLISIKIFGNNALEGINDNL